MAPFWKDEIIKTKTKKQRNQTVISLRPAVTSVFFISSSYSIRKQNPNPCSFLQCHLVKSGALFALKGWGEASRKSLHLCSPLRRGNRASLGNRKPNRAMVRRIQAGRFCLWCLMNWRKTEKTRTLVYCRQLEHVKSLWSSERFRNSNFSDVFDLW